MKQSTKVQIVVVGGGIAGLWLLNRLRGQGYQTILLEKRQLGGQQTLASQGIIHGGLKYALNGVFGPASSAIADMPRRWRECLDGTGELDLGSCRVLSPHFFMWSSGGYRSRLKTFLGSKALRGRIDPLREGQQPAFFREQQLPGTVYQLTDPVLDVPSLVHTLASANQHCIFHAPYIAMTGPASLTLGELEIQADKIVLCAGEGNETLLADLGVHTPAMQRRPLHMVHVSHDYPHAVFAHCIGEDFGMTPRMTITTHPLPDGRNVWYLGGEIAETGVNRDTDEQITFARRELQSLFPSLTLDNARWQTLRINRAEPDTRTGQRPDSAFVDNRDGLMVAWPTKLTLCPDLGDTVLRSLEQEGIGPADNLASEQTLLAGLRRAHKFPEYARQPWEAAAMETTS